MDSVETKWIDWHPKVGDVFPVDYRFRRHHRAVKDWRKGTMVGFTVSQWHAENFDYQTPAPEEKATSMKYWQPRIEPMQKGWMLADVPDDVLCEIEHPSHGKCFAKRTTAGPAYVGEKCISNHTEQCRVIRVIDPIPPGEMTLDKVPEYVLCCVVVNHVRKVCCRKGKNAYEMATAGPEDFLLAVRIDNIEVTHILDPVPEVSYTLETLPVGRVIEHAGAKVFNTGNGWKCWLSDGSMPNVAAPFESEPFTVTDILMELKEVV